MGKVYPNTNRKMLIIIDNVQIGSRWLECNEQGKPGGGGHGRGRRGPELGGTRVREGLGVGSLGQG